MNSLDKMKMGMEIANISQALLTELQRVSKDGPTVEILEGVALFIAATARATSKQVVRLDSTMTTRTITDILCKKAQDYARIMEEQDAK